MRTMFPSHAMVSLILAMLCLFSRILVWFEHQRITYLCVSRCRFCVDDENAWFTHFLSWCIEDKYDTKTVSLGCVGKTKGGKRKTDADDGMRNVSIGQRTIGWKNNSFLSIDSLSNLNFILEVDKHRSIESSNEGFASPMELVLSVRNKESFVDLRWRSCQTNLRRKSVGTDGDSLDSLARFPEKVRDKISPMRSFENIWKNNLTKWWNSIRFPWTFPVAKTPGQSTSTKRYVEAPCLLKRNLLQCRPLTKWVPLFNRREQRFDRRCTERISMVSESLAMHWGRRSTRRRTRNNMHTCR